MPFNKLTMVDQRSLICSLKQFAKFKDTWLVNEISFYVTDAFFAWGVSHNYIVCAQNL